MYLHMAETALVSPTYEDYEKLCFLFPLGTFLGKLHRG